MTDTRRRSIASVAAAAAQSAGGPAHVAAAVPHRPNLARAKRLLAGMNSDPLWPAHAIQIAGAIDDAMVRSVRDQIRALPPTARRVLLVIDSPGGYLSAEREIVAALAALERPIDGHVAKQAASAAALLLARCEHRTAAPGARILFHLAGYLEGPKGRLTAGTLREMLSNLETADKRIIDDVLRGRLRLSSFAIGEILAGNDWEVTSAAAERLGIVHRITSAPSAPPAGWRAEPSAVPELKDRNRLAAEAARKPKTQPKVPYSPRITRHR